MQALLEEFISSHSFYNADCGDLCSQAQLAATSVADGHLREVLSRAAEYLAFGDVRAALVDLLYAQRLAPSHSLITLLIGDTRLHLGIAEAAQPFELLARRSSWSGAWYRLVLAHFRNRNYDLASLELHEALSLNAPLLDADSVQLMADVTRGSEAAGWCGLNNRGQLLMGGAAATAAGVQVTVEIDGAPRTLGRRRTIRRHTLCSFDLGAEVLRGSLLRVRVNSTPLLGSPIQIGSVTRMEGFVDRHDGTVTGWCWLPGEPNVRPEVTVAKPADQAPMLRCQAADLVDTPDNLQNLRWQRTFAFSTASLPEGMLLVRDGRGRSLYGSPLNPSGSWTSGMIAAAKLARRFPVMGEPELTDSDEASEISIPALHKGRRLPVSGTEEIRRGVLVAIPVYRGYETTMRCLESVMLHRGNERIFVVSDASPDPRILKALNRLAAHGAIELRQETINRGFPGTANLALREAASAGLDIVLLNSDTIVSAGWVERLGDAAYSAPNIGTATPFSNSATILSYPDRGALNAVPDVAQANALAAQFFEANGSATVEIPTGHGFCLYIKHACLSETGSLREDVFAQGYGEENDFCLRARHLGWRHVAAAGVYVAHVEGQSFAPAKTSLVQRNLRNLNLLHPGYDGLIADWAGRDPLMECRRRVDWLRLAAIQGTRAAICFVTHAREGGVLRQVEARARAAEKDGFASFILSPRKGSQGQRYCDIRMPGCAFPNLRFSVDRDLDLFKSFLQQRALAHIELHHFIGHDERLIQMMSRLEVPFDIYLHDYSWFCPRITLTYDNRYCGEPAVKVCEACVQDKGSSIEWEVSPRDLILWSQDLFTRARVVVAPTTDTAIRFERRFGIMPKVVAWEMERRPVQLRPIPTIGQGRVRKICVAGAIGYEKGYEVILGCARYAAAHDLPVEFQIVGFTCDDARLIATRKVTVTGRYDESEAVSLIRQQESDFGFLPALWPETWSFVLSQLWEAGLPVVAFDIGAQSERIRSSGAGLVLPMNLPVDKLVHSLCRVSS